MNALYWGEMIFPKTGASWEASSLEIILAIKLHKLIRKKSVKPAGLITLGINANNVEENPIGKLAPTKNS